MHLCREAILFAGQHICQVEKTMLAYASCLSACNVHLLSHQSTCASCPGYSSFMHGVFFSNVAPFVPSRIEGRNMPA